jgi:hypothetical protein
MSGRAITSIFGSCKRGVFGFPHLKSVVRTKFSMENAGPNSRVGETTHQGKSTEARGEFFETENKAHLPGLHKYSPQKPPEDRNKKLSESSGDFLDNEIKAHPPILHKHGEPDRTRIGETNEAFGVKDKQARDQERLTETSGRFLDTEIKSHKPELFSHRIDEPGDPASLTDHQSNESFVRKAPEVTEVKPHPPHDSMDADRAQRL